MPKGYWIGQVEITDPEKELKSKLVYGRGI